MFHVRTLLFMNIFFPYHLAMYLVFVDGERLRGRSDFMLVTHLGFAPQALRFRPLRGLTEIQLMMSLSRDSFSLSCRATN